MRWSLQAMTTARNGSLAAAAVGGDARTRAISPTRRDWTPDCGSSRSPRTTYRLRRPTRVRCTYPVATRWLTTFCAARSVIPVAAAMSRSRMSGCWLSRTRTRPWVDRKFQESATGANVGTAVPGLNPRPLSR